MYIFYFARAIPLTPNGDIPEINHANLDSIEVESESIREETRKALNEAKAYLSGYKESGDTEKYLSALEEYNEVGKKYQEATADGRIMHDELDDLKQDVADVANADGGFKEMLDGDDLWNKSIEDMDNSEAAFVLGLTQTDFGKYESQDLNKMQKLSALFTNSFTEVSNRSEMNIFQTKLIRKIHGEDFAVNGYNEQNLLGYNNKIGNQVIEISIFENDLKTKSPNEWNSAALVHYFDMLLSTGPINITILTNIFGASQLVRLKNEWTKETAGPAKQKLMNNPQVSWLINGEIDYEAILQDPEDFRKVAQIFDELDDLEKSKIQEKVVKYFVERPEYIDSVDIDGNQDGIFDASILKARNIIGTKKIIKVYTDRYAGGPEVADIIDAVLMFAIKEEENVFRAEDFDGVNEIIDDYNKVNGTSYPTIDGNQLISIIGALSKSSQLATEYGVKMKGLLSSQEALSTLYKKKSKLHQQLRSVKKERENIAIQSIQEDIEEIDFKIYQIQDDIGRQEKQVEETEEAVEEAEESIENLYKLFSQVSEEKVLLNPKLYIGTIDNSETLLKIFSEMGSNPDFLFRDIHPKLQKDIRIFEAYPNNIRIEDIQSLSENSIKSQENFEMCIKKALKQDIYMNNGMLNLIIRKHLVAIEGNTKICIENINYILSSPDISDMSKIILRKAIPYTIILADTGNTLGIENKNERTSVISEASFDLIKDKLKTSQTLSELEKTNFDKYIEYYKLGAHLDAAELFIKAGYLGSSRYLKYALEIYSSDDEIKHDFHLHKIALEQDLGNIRYFGEMLRGSPETIQMITHGVIHKDKSAMEYLKLLNIQTLQSLEKLYNGLGANNSAKNIIASTPNFYSTCINIKNDAKIPDENKILVDEILNTYEDINKQALSTKDSVEKQRSILKEIPQFEDIMIQEIAKVLGKKAEKMSDEQLRIIHDIWKEGELQASSLDYGNFLKLCDNDKSKAQKALEAVSSIAIEISSKRSLALMFQLQGISSKDTLDTLGIGLTESNESLKLDFVNNLGIYINTFPEVEGETAKQKITRCGKLYLESQGLTLSSKEKEIIISILQENSKQIEWLFLRDNSEEVSDAYDNEGNAGIQDLANTYLASRLKSGNLSVSDEERAGKIIYNHDIGGFEPNPNYTPPQDENFKKDNSETVPPVKQNPPKSAHQSSYEIGGTLENPTITIGESIIQLDHEEAEALKNPEAMENFVNADKYFQTAGLTSIWRLYRKEMVAAMNMSGGDIQINLNDDSLNKTEFLKFAQFSYKVANGKNASPSNKVSDLQNQFKQYGDIHAEDKSLLGDRFVTDLNTIGINRELTSSQISAKFSKFAKGEGLSQEVEKIK